MAPKLRADSTDPDVLEEIADSIRGTHRTVEDMAQTFIREAILRGVFPPGQRLNLDAIAATLGVSRMPVRAGLKHLEVEGLLQIHPYRGATVSVLEAKEIAEIYEIRALLECYLIDHLIDRLDDALVDELQAVVNALEDADELGPSLERRRAFYQLLYERADRPRALAQVNNLRDSVGRYLLLQRVNEHHGHQDFVNFLRARDAEGAKAWLTAHLAHVSETLQSMVGEQESSSA